MANYYDIWIKFHRGFSYVTHYMKHSLLGTRRVILSIITRNFFVTGNKQPVTIGTNRMCISRDDNCVNTMCFPRQLPQLQELSSTGVIRVALSVSYLLVSYFVVNFLSIPQLSKYVSIRPNERFRKVLQSWRSMQYFATACEEDTN